MDTPIDLRVDDRVAVITLNRPEKRNALSEHTMRQLDSTARLVAADHRVRALVLTGNGPVFSAGGDLSDVRDLDDTLGLARRHEIFLAAAKTLSEIHVPTIAAVNGPAVGAGFSLALLCDLVVVQDDAVLQTGFLDVGLPPDLFAAASLQARVGATRAADLLLNGARLDAAEAVRMDIANETATDALATATERARALADRSAHAVEQTVRLLRSVRPPTNVSMAVEPLAVAAAVGTAEFREATARFR